MTPALVTELKRLGREAKAHPMSINLGCEYTDALMLRAPALLEAVETMHAALQFAQNYAEVEYREGDKGYQFAIYCREALARVAALLGEGREK